MKTIDSPIGYMGKKYRQLKYILPKLDKSKSNFIDLFAGSGVVYANVLEYYDNIFINDLNLELIELHQVILNDAENFKKNIRKITAKEEGNQHMFDLLRDAYNFNRTPERLFCIMLLSRVYGLRYNLNGDCNSSFSGRRLFDNVETKIDDFVNQVKKWDRKLTFSSKCFSDFQIPQDSMCVADAPYFNSNAGYNRQWDYELDELLYKKILAIHEHGNSFMLFGTLLHNDKGNQFLRKLIGKNDFHYEELPNERLDRNKGYTIEVMITNYKPSE